MVVAACLAASLVPAVPAFAGSSVQLTGSAQIEYVSVSLDTTDTLNYGSGTQGGTVTKSFTARNNGSLAADWDVIATNATDTASDVWTLGTSAGANKFVWAASGAGVNPLSLSTSWQRLADAVGPDATRAVDLAFTFPTVAKSSLVHTAYATLRATGSGGAAPSTQSITFNNNVQGQVLHAVAGQPIDITFDPSVMGCSANIAFVGLSAPTIVKTSGVGQNVSYHSDGLPAGTYQWKCSMTDCCYGSLVVE